MTLLGARKGDPLRHVLLRIDEDEDERQHDHNGSRHERTEIGVMVVGERLQSHLYCRQLPVGEHDERP